MVQVTRSDGGTLQAYTDGQLRIFKEPVPRVPTSRHRFIPSQADFKQEIGGVEVADVYTHGARGNYRRELVVGSGNQEAYTKIVHTVADIFWDHIAASSVGNNNLQYILYPAINYVYRDTVPGAAQNAFALLPDSDPLYFDISRALSYQVQLYSLASTYFRREEPAVRSRVEFDRREILLDFNGMSACRPHAIFPTVDFYSAFIQDFHIFCRFKPMFKAAGILPDHPLITMELTPETSNPTELIISSHDGFDQTTKELQKADQQTPLMERYRNTFSSGGEGYTLDDARRQKHYVEFETNRGPPEYVFVKLERDVTPGAIFTTNQPRIKQLSLELFNQDVTSLSVLDETSLYHAVRRNSNYRADTAYNIEQDGAVLLTKVDFGNWARWNNRLFVDNFRGRMTVLYDASSRDRTLPSALDLELSLQPVTATLVFVYEKYGLVGTAHNNRFRLL